LSVPESLLTFEFDEQAFLASYWQRRPLLIKGALPNWRSPITPEELAGLALEEEADSRLIGKSNSGWALKRGPLSPLDFQRTDDWTLLVNGVDQWVPEVAALKQCLRFLPQWRFDDVMQLCGHRGRRGPPLRPLRRLLSAREWTKKMAPR